MSEFLNKLGASIEQKLERLQSFYVVTDPAEIGHFGAHMISCTGKGPLLFIRQKRHEVVPNLTGVGVPFLYSPVPDGVRIKCAECKGQVQVPQNTL